MGFPLSFEALPSSPTSPSLYPPNCGSEQSVDGWPPGRSPTTLTLATIHLSTNKHTSPAAHQSDDPSGPSAQQNVRPLVPREGASARW